MLVVELFQCINVLVLWRTLKVLMQLLDQVLGYIMKAWQRDKAWAVLVSTIGERVLLSQGQALWVVLLEIITSRPVITRTHERIHISQWVGFMLANGDIDSIVDPRLEGNFNTNSVWKAVEIAMACVSINAIKGPSMSQVVVDLKECLATEYARTKHSRVGEFENPNELMPDNSIARLTPSVR
ncbi:putative LRR receptor-like serine/threonine-protein kinase [Prunus yedoensis var. nudiflora]|uniref:Putative LRR receptor-like serine/threonine-protein kinase n=1 Tax=Prunus yedoensis var. nudiflora TaxID=2094558 RepID=A0A314YA20_PRUYE|nr:putative LRR receptor-like serine/threonine-protein kinase [Prunus yedoensis var. nudiflora]